MRAFPDGFAWGVATAAYQVEGSLHADGRGPSVWDAFSARPGAILDGATAETAADHYRRWRGDVALLRELGVNAYRFSIAWPRVLPRGRGPVNEPGLAFYERLVDALLAAGIAPWVTLYHWDLPLALDEHGGWLARDTAQAFAEYADVVTRRLGDRVPVWMTVNEPWVNAFYGYQAGIHAPGHTSLPEALQAAHTLLLAHGLAVPVVRANSPAARVGIVLNPAACYPATPSPDDQAAAQRVAEQQNRWFLAPLYGRGYPPELLARYGAAAPRVGVDDLALIATPTDFLGVNYYTPVFARADPSEPLAAATAVLPPDLDVMGPGWAVYPRGLRDLLRDLARDYPVHSLVVTENGAGYPDPPPRAGRVPDPRRTRYLAEHVAAVHAAIADGAPVRGYLVWSLFDIWEWHWGERYRFGLVYLDRPSGARTIKDSGRWYARVARANALPPL
jgi:beta-glucosidase